MIEEWYHFFQVRNQVPDEKALQTADPETVQEMCVCFK